MARIRTIKPEFWHSGQVMDCSPQARLLFIGMWTFADDEGRMRCAETTIRAQIFPNDRDVDAATVRRWLDELSTNDLIAIYEVAGDRYIQITGWHHQKIDHPRKSKLPAFSTNAREASRNGATAHRSLAPDLNLLNQPNVPNLSKGEPTKTAAENFELKTVSCEKTNEGLTVPRHGARSRDRRFVYFHTGTWEFDEYVRDYEEGTGEEPAATSHGRWFLFHGEVADRIARSMRDKSGEPRQPPKKPS